jgi:uncharacterized protein YPO0396
MPAIAEVVELIDKPAGTVVHLRLLPGGVNDYADAHERTLRSYVEGHYKSERNEATGTARPVGLRDARSFSVILGVFANVDYGTTVTLAQVFRPRPAGDHQ